MVSLFPSKLPTPTLDTPSVHRIISAVGKLDAIPTPTANVGPRAVLPPVSSLPTLSLRLLYSRKQRGCVKSIQIRESLTEPYFNERVKTFNDRSLPKAVPCFMST